MRNITILTIICALLTSCEKEIELDYRSVEKLYVIEGILNDSKAKVIITKTRDMSDATNSDYVDNASVTVKSHSGKEHTLNHIQDGVYTTHIYPSQALDSYTLNVEIDGKTFSSQSEIYDTAPEIVNAKFVNMDMPFGDPQSEEGRMIYMISIQDKPKIENYYRYTVSVNDSLYQWGVNKDSYKDGEILKVMIMTNKEDIENGDIVHTEVQSIDKSVYDYLYSVILSDRSSSNPIYHFTGGCLGYFSAYRSSEVEHEFNSKDIDEL